MAKKCKNCGRTLVKLPGAFSKLNKAVMHCPTCDHAGVFGIAKRGGKAVYFGGD